MKPSNVDMRKVEGRYIMGVRDGEDPDSEPDFIAAEGTFDFLASVPYLPDPTADPSPVVIFPPYVKGVLDSEGYLCTARLDGTPGERGVWLIVTDDPDLPVSNWTWNVSYKFTMVDGVLPKIEPHSFAVPSGSEPINLVTVVKTPASPGYGLPQAEAAVLRAEGAAVSSAEDAALAVAAADRAEQVAGATDAGVAILLGDAGTETGALLEAGLAPKADIVAVDGALALKADLDGGLVPDDQTPAGVTTSLNNLSAVKADKSTVENDLAFKADSTALAAVAPEHGVRAVGKGELVVNVKDYGAKGDGTTDDTAAILAAQSAAAYPVKPLKFPAGVFPFSATLTAQNILGDNRQKTILKYTGTGDAVNNGGSIAYHRRVEHLTILGPGVGTGLNLDTSPAGSYVNLIVQGFDTGISLDGTGAADALYNVFDDVTVQSTATGVRVQGFSHENRFKNFRINYATTGFNFISGGRNVIESAAVENTTTGVIIHNDGSGTQATRANVIANTRFEFNTTNIEIESGVEMTGLLFNRYIGGALVDNGTYTMNVDISNGTYKGTAIDVATAIAGAVKTAAAYAKSSFADARIQFGLTGTTIDRNVADSNPALRVNNINAGALGNIQEWLAAGVLKARVSASGHLGIRVNSSPADNTIATGEAMFWLDSTNGATKLMVRAKQADGAVRVGSIPLT